MKNLTSIIALSLLGVSGVGCAADAPKEEPTAQSEDNFIGWLVSPPSFGGEHLAGTWKPVDPQGFHGEAKTLEFAANRDYREGSCTSEGDCPKIGTWDLTDHPVPTAVVGTYVNMHPTGRADEHRFVWRHPSGEIRLVDMRSCNFLFFFCSNQWAKSPSLTTDDL